MHGKKYTMKTFSAKSHEVKRDWLLVDATDATLGRLASAIAHRLRGKHKAIYTPHVDTGDYIVVINADKLKVTGDNLKEKYIIAIQDSLADYTLPTLKRCKTDFREEH